MDIMQLITALVQILALILGVVGAALVVRAPGVNPSGLVDSIGPRTRRRARAVLWVVLAGLILAPLREIASEVILWVRIVRSPDTLSQIPPASLVITVGTTAGVIAGYVLAWLLFQRLDWTAIGRRTGWHPSLAQRLFLFLALGLFLTWPIAVPLQIAGLALSAARTQQDVVLQSSVGIIQSLIGHGLGLFAAGSILRRIDGRHERYFEPSRTLINGIVLIALTSMLAQGVLHLFSLTNALFQSMLPLLGASAVNVSVERTTMRLILQGLPLLAYVPAVFLIRRIDWDVMEERSGWRPAALDEVLIFLTLAVWLTWPLQLPQLVLSTILPALFPNFSVVLAHVIVAAVTAIALYGVFVYNPGAREEVDLGVEGATPEADHLS